jgi:hypothetical protein
VPHGETEDVPCVVDAGVELPFLAINCLMNALAQRESLGIAWLKTSKV